MAITDAYLGNFTDEEKLDYTLDNDEILSRAVDRVNDFFNYFNQNIRNSESDINFVMTPNGQWDPDIFSKRQQANKPCFQVNNIYSIITSIVGMERANTPEFKIFSYVDENNPKVQVDQEAIDLRDNLLRQITFDTDAQVQFQTTFKNQLARGYGAVIVGTRYESDYSFNQVPTIEGVTDPSICFWDPTDKSPDKTAGRFSGYLQTFTIEGFKEAYPDSKSANSESRPTSFQANTFSQTMAYLWRGKDYIRVAHYYVRVKTPIEIYKMNDGRSMTEKEAEEAIAHDLAERYKAKRKEKLLINNGVAMPQDMDINKIKKLDYAYDDHGNKVCRSTLDEKIMHYVLTSDEILECSEFPVSGKKYLPIVFFDGDSDYIQGQQVTKSFHATAKDPQRILNYLSSASVENLMNLNKSAFIGTAENFSGYEDSWKDPSRATGSMVANRDSAGQLPQQLQPPQISPSYMPLIQQSMSDISNSLGYFSSNRGQQGNETSGVAIKERYERGDLANFVYRDNLHRGIDKVYKIVLSLIPKLYDTNRDVIIRTKNNESKSITINENSPLGTKNDLTKGNFSLEVTCGSNYKDQMADNFDQIMRLVESLVPSAPQTAIALGDLIASNINLKNTPQIVDRVRGLMMGLNPQQILKHEMGLQDPPPAQQPQGPDPQMMQMQIQQMHEQNAAESIKLQQSKLEMDHEKNLIDAKKIENDLQIAMLKSKTDIEVKNIELKRELIAANAEEYDAHQMGGHIDRR